MSAKKIKVRVKANINRQLIEGAVKRGGKKATWSALDYLATESKKQVPLDTGALMNSCVVDVNEDGTEGTVSYDTPYAVRQHEVTTYNHQRGRKAKYLEDPAYNSAVQSKMVELAKQAFSTELE